MCAPKALVTARSPRFFWRGSFWLRNKADECSAPQALLQRAIAERRDTPTRIMQCHEDLQAKPCVLLCSCVEVVELS